ncbi:MAG: PEP-CTERM sorting domain-containing protein [Planctomycetota bacterium]
MVTVLIFAFLVAIPNVRGVTITVDFDALDTSGTASVSGATLDSYLAGFGVTLTNVTPTTSVFVGDIDNEPSASPSSSPNWLDQWWNGINGVSYQLDFDNVLNSLSFTRVGLAPTAPTLAPEWSVTVFDAFNNSLGSVGEPLRSVWSFESPVTHSFNTPGITHMVVFSNVHGVAGMGGMPIDDLVLTSSAEPVPEPATIALLGIGLSGLAGGALRRRLKKAKQ